jgi:hypothetical protein
MAKWLYRISTQIMMRLFEMHEIVVINLFASIAKWLYSLGGVNIHANNDEAFRRV